MDLIVSNLRIPVETDAPEFYVKAAAEKLDLPVSKVLFIRPVSKSLDARSRKQFYYEMSVAVAVPGDYPNSQGFEFYKTPPAGASSPKPITHHSLPPLIVGFGPAGMFAALELIERGLKPVILERGKKVEDRHADVATFMQRRKLNKESNIQFGEGGAGTYSDGKLFSRIKNFPAVAKVLDTFVKFGAPEEISYTAKPHLGTDVLTKIVKSIREHILAAGGEIHFNSKVTDVLVSDGAISGIVINGEKEFLSDAVFLAVGHSARDTFALLEKKGVTLEAKPTAVGVRIEHPARAINLLRYGKKYADFAPIGAAAYSFTHTDRDIKRGTYTFCMCPGGEIVNASSEEGRLTLNGMSYSIRAGRFSNSAIIVTCGPEDYGGAGPLAGVEFQRMIEAKAFEAGGKRWAAPAQMLVDFLAGKPSAKLVENSFKTGVTPARIDGVFPEFVSAALKAAFNKWKEDYPRFVSEEALLLAPETRSSCPLRVVRGPDYQSVSVKGLYPIGEGSGYTGGITSSAADAIKAVASYCGL